MRIEMVLKDYKMGVGENGSKVRVALYVQELDYKKGIYELGDHVGEEALNLNLPLKFGFTKKTPPASFPIHLLKNT
jgi:hypothetical protein